jgi:hypothetical protein
MKIKYCVFAIVLIFTFSTIEVSAQSASAPRNIQATVSAQIDTVTESQSAASNSLTIDSEMSNNEL